MKNSLNPILFVLFAFVSTLSFGQISKLEITNTNTAQVKKIKAMTEIEVVTSIGTFEGPLVFLNANTIQVGVFQVPLSDIQCIMHKNKKAAVACLAVGSVMCASGAISYVWISFWNSFGLLLDKDFTTSVYLMSGGAATFVSGIYLITHKAAYPNTKYRYQIVL
jgi:hypothetical protein